MLKKLIAAVSMLGVGGAFALTLLLGAPASANTNIDALGCRLTNSGATICY